MHRLSIGTRFKGNSYTGLAKNTGEHLSLGKVVAMLLRGGDQHFLLPGRLGAGFFLMHKAEHKQCAGSRGGPREGAELRLTTGLLNNQQLQVLFLIQRVQR